MCQIRHYSNYQKFSTRESKQNKHEQGTKEEEDKEGSGAEGEKHKEESRPESEVDKEENDTATGEDRMSNVILHEGLEKPKIPTLPKFLLLQKAFQRLCCYCCSSAQADGFEISILLLNIRQPSKDWRMHFALVLFRLILKHGGCSFWTKTRGASHWVFQQCSFEARKEPLCHKEGIVSDRQNCWTLLAQISLDENS